MPLPGSINNSIPTQRCCVPVLDPRKFHAYVQCRPFPCSSHWRAVRLSRRKSSEATDHLHTLVWHRNRKGNISYIKAFRGSSAPRSSIHDSYQELWPHLRSQREAPATRSLQQYQQLLKAVPTPPHSSLPPCYFCRNQNVPFISDAAGATLKKLTHIETRVNKVQDKPYL